MTELAAAMTELDRDPDLRVGVLCAEGDNFTAGLDMTKFFGPSAKSSEGIPSFVERRAAVFQGR